MQEDKNTYVMDLGHDKLYVLKVSSFDSEIDTNDILRIDYSNIMGELLTFSLVYNRIANMKADADNLVIKAKHDLEVYEARIAEIYRLENTAGEADGKGVIKTKKPSEKEIENYVLTHDTVIKIKHKYFELLRNQGIMESLYWSAKDKSEKLNRLSEKIRPEDFHNELLEDTINGVLIKQRNKIVKD